MKKLLILFIYLSVSGAAMGQVKLKVASVDTNAVINRSKEGKDSKELLAAQKKQSDNYLQAKVQELRKKQEELENSMMLTDKAKQEKMAELQKMYVDLKREEAKAANDFRENEKRYAETIFMLIKPVIKSIAEREKFDMVLDKSLIKGLLYHNFNIIDITDQVITEFNNLQSTN